MVIIIRNIIQISMSFKWREGMNADVKEKVIALMNSLAAPELLDEKFAYLKYSQFFKVCVNKYGSKCNNIQEGYKDQQEFYGDFLEIKCRQMYPCISQFVFGFRIQKERPPKEMIYINNYPKNADSIEQFKRRVDRYLEERTRENMVNLLRKYCNSNFQALKAQFQAVLKQECESEQAYNSSLRSWESLVAEAMNFNCFYQILADINTTYKNITDFRSNLAKNMVALHANKVLENLYNYGLKHKETQYN